MSLKLGKAALEIKIIIKMYTKREVIKYIRGLKIE